MLKNLWIKLLIATACVIFTFLIVVQAFKCHYSGCRNVEGPRRQGNLASPEKVVKNERSEKSPTNREAILDSQFATGDIYNEGSPDSKMDSENLHAAYYLSNVTTSRISLTPVAMDSEHEVELHNHRDIQPSGKYQLKRGGVLGKQLYSIDGRFVRCLPLSINVERGFNPDAAECCADNINWNWLDDQRLIGIQPIDLKGAPDPFGGQEPATEQTVPTPSYARIYVLDMGDLNRIYEVSPLPPLPPYYAVELSAITKDGLISLTAINHIQDSVSPQQKIMRLGYYKVDPTPK